jgi:hypothetical protein
MYQQLWGYKVEEKLYLGVREQKRLNTTVLEDLRKLGVKSWWMVVKDRESWKKVLRGAGSHIGL